MQFRSELLFLACRNLLLYYQGTRTNEKARIMNLDLPDEAVEYLAKQASQAGFDDAKEYLLTIVEQDQTATQYAESLAEDVRLEKLALEGLKSGDAGPMTNEDWADIRSKLDERIANRNSDSSR